MLRVLVPAQARYGARVLVLLAASVLATAGGAAGAAAAPPTMVIGGVNDGLGGGSHFYALFTNLESGVVPHTIAITTPLGYTGPIARPVESVLGKVRIVTLSADGVTRTPFGGSLTVIRASDFAANPVATVCAPGPHAATWLLAASNGSTSFSFPVAIDAVGAQYRLTICAGAVPPDVRLSEVSFATTGVLQNPTTPGTYGFSAIVTAATTEGAPDPATAYELRGDVVLPQVLTVESSYDLDTKALTVSGMLSALGKPRSALGKPSSDIRVEIKANDCSPALAGTLVGTATISGAADTYALTLTTDNPPACLFAHVGAYAAGKCAAPSTAPGGCLSQSLDSVDSHIISTVRTRTIRLIAVPDKAHTRITVDQRPRGWSKGDTLAYRNVFVNAVPQFGRDSGATVGSDAGTRMRYYSGGVSDSGSARLPGGKITFRGFPVGGKTVIKVVGGSGDYKQARGTLTIGVGARPTTTFRLTLGNVGPAAP